MSDPPPVASDSGTTSDYSGDSADYAAYASAAGAAGGDTAAPAPPPGAPAAGEPGPVTAASLGGGSGEVYLYPRNGQSDAQAQNDRYECHTWAANQSEFDPTHPSQQGSSADYRRAMIACLDARGYSAR
ncbi:MAG: hypothetical protein JOZ89_07460 [Gammaproteobacteria bacterium]|nr:hypothetical protein [Gammaproteobacteria bacterium]